MTKNIHEFRDPIHGFIKCYTNERAVIDSVPFQRLRHIHHLATGFLIYPGATHRRFEHSLGVMELATNIYDILTQNRNLKHLKERTLLSIPEVEDKHELSYWRKVLRMAALCHDVGHLPFSHGAESLLPQGESHESMTWRLIVDEMMRPLWSDLRIDPLHVAKIAVGPKETAKVAPGEKFSVWETIVAEIVVGEIFGADRMDYLLRDSLHTGVAYGKFDHRRLIDTLRILPKAREGSGEEEQSAEPSIGVEIGGLQAAESLIMARYLMFSQVYCHHVRRIYDIHLREFMEVLYPEGLPIVPDEFVLVTDNEILSEMRKAIDVPDHGGHVSASRLLARGHFKKVYQQTEEHRLKYDEPSKTVYNALASKFGLEKVRRDNYGKRTSLAGDFPVWVNEGSTSAKGESLLLRSFPPVSTGFIYVAPAIQDQAKYWLETHLAEIFEPINKGEES